MRFIVFGLAASVVIAAFLARAGLLGGVARRLPFVGRQPLEELTKDELYDLAREADIPGRSSMTKDELVAALRGDASRQRPG
jgi:DNA end-binding protein Ku